MSTESWKKEFYPVPVEDVPKSKALAHSIKKWEGLLAKNLKRHAVVWRFACYIVDEVDDKFYIDGGTCALCHHYLGDDSSGDDRVCVRCPLFKSRNGTSCVTARTIEVNSPYGHWIDGGNPAPMLRELRKVKKEHMK
jgi:hypothetical protein